MNQAALDHARAMLLAIEPAALPPQGVLVLARDYVSSGAAPVRDLLEHVLTLGLDAAVSHPDAYARIEWVRALSAAVTLCEDERLADVVSRALPSAIDALEARVRRSYEPGEGLLDEPCAEQLRCSAALLGAFDLSARLPYAMLAEELLQYARRRWWREPRGAFEADFSANCTALEVLCRLSTLHADPDYRAAAIVAPASSYRDDARCIARDLEQRSVEHPQDAALYASALVTWFALDSDLQ